MRKAVPTLIFNPNARIILNGMAYIAVYDVLPLSLNAANNQIQTYFRSGHQDDTDWLTPYSVFLSGLTVINCAVTAYTWREGIQSTARIFFIDW